MDALNQKEFYFDDIEIGHSESLGSYTLSAENIVEFAEKWDPMPFHVNQDNCEASIHGGLIACGVHLLGIRMILTHNMEALEAVVASFGYDDVRFKAPARPGDTLSLFAEWTEMRESNSRPDCGIAKLFYRLGNQDGETVLSHFDNLLIRKRP